MAPKVQYGSPRHAVKVQEVQEVPTQIDQFIDSQSTRTDFPSRAAGGGGRSTNAKVGCIQFSSGVWCLVSGVYCLVSGVYRLASWCVALAVKRIKYMLFTDQCFGCSAV